MKCALIFLLGTLALTLNACSTLEEMPSTSKGDKILYSGQKNDQVTINKDGVKYGVGF